MRASVCNSESIAKGFATPALIIFPSSVSLRALPRSSSNCLAAAELEPQRRHWKALRGGRPTQSKTAVDAIDTEGNSSDLAARRRKGDRPIEALTAQAEPPGAGVDFDRTPLREQKKRNAEQNQIHQRKIPERSRRANEAANAKRFDDRHRDKQQQQRDAQTEKRGETRASPQQADAFGGFLDDTKTEAIADGFKLRGVRRS